MKKIYNPVFITEPMPWENDPSHPETTNSRFIPIVGGSEALFTYSIWFSCN